VRAHIITQHPLRRESGERTENRFDLAGAMLAVRG
jgi:hypothetical protein